MKKLMIILSIFFCGINYVFANDKVEFLITLNDKTVIKDCPLVITTRPLGNSELTNTRSYSVSAETEAVHIDL